VLKPIFALLALFVAFLSPQSPPAAPAPIPPEAAAMVNPVKPTPASQAFAKKMYGYDCAMCHGVNGDGKGDLTADFKTPLKDFTDPASLKDRTDGELFYIIQNGRGTMQGEGERLKTDAVWNMVLLVRGFAKK
jgi:mono/diheme cytochrome c family protein